jgi:sugar phosphate isomerase/epimerase
MSQEASITTPRIAFSTLAFPDADLATAVSLGRSWGYAGVELRLIDGELIDPAMLPEARARVKRTLAAAGLPAAAVDTSIRLTGGYQGWVSVEWEKRWHPEIAEPEVALPQHLAVLGTWIRDMKERQDRA